METEDAQRIEALVQNARDNIANSPMDVWASASSPTSKLHLVRECDGLERVRSVEAATARSVKRLLTCERLLCRRCALQAALEAGWSQRWVGRTVTFTLTAQPPRGSASDLTATSLTGNRRVEELARAVGLATTTGVYGPAAWGHAPRALIDVVSQYFRVLAAERRVEHLSDQAVLLMWALADKAGSDDQANTPQLWQLAQAMSA